VSWCCAVVLVRGLRMDFLNPGACPPAPPFLTACSEDSGLAATQAEADVSVA
jgi:hypothetical protein